MNGAEKRRHRRVHFRGDVGQGHRILGATVTWPNQEVSDVFDLSVKGLAVSRPALVDLKVGGLQSVAIELGEKQPFLVPARIVWLKEQLVGLEMGDVSAEAHLLLHEFLTDKLVGQCLKPVDHRFFSGDQDFDHWFQGPNGTHLFLWSDPKDAARIIKVHLELDEGVWEFENGRVTKGENLNERAIQILGQILVTQFRLRDVIEKVATKE